MSVVRVLFLEVDTERSWAVASIGPGFIGAYLRAHGHEVDFYRADLDTTTDAVVAEVVRRAPDVLGLSLTTRQWLRGRELVAAIRAVLDVPVVAGGLHPTFSPQEVLACDGFDYACLGEGETAMLDLVEALAAGGSTAGIANMWQRGAGHPGLRQPFEPLDDMPFLARDLLDEKPGVIHMTTQRGCPFPCTYCAARMYNQLYKDTGEYGRRRTHDNVLAELHQLQDAGVLSYVIFLDDTFTINHPWVREFCRRYRDELAVPFSLHARVETVKPAMLAELASAGCQQITYGVESGSERIRREVMRRPVTNDRFREVFQWTRDAGIAVTANYMLGIPGETRDDLAATVELASELDVLDFGYFVFYPYPGTQLFHECKARGYLPDDYLTRPANHRESILDLPGLSRDDVAEFYDRFTDLRRRRYRERWGVQMPDDDAPDEVVDHVDDLARTG